MKKLLTGGLFLLLGLVVLTGCEALDESEDSDTATPQQKTAATVGDDVDLTNELTDEARKIEDGSGIALTAKALGNSMVKFQWTVSEVETDKEKGFVLVRSMDEEPVHDGLNYWFRQYYRNREATWVDLPTGTMHFRICALQNGECAVYSNDIELEVK